jgi:hypothetical protein
LLEGLEEFGVKTVTGRVQSPYYNGQIMSNGFKIPFVSAKNQDTVVIKLRVHGNGGYGASSTVLL